MSDNFYEILGVDCTATDAEIKAAWRKLSKRHHPDRKGGDPEMMAKVNRAYECLGDPDRRAHYDQTGVDRKPQKPNDIARNMVMWAINEGIKRDRGVGYIHRARNALASKKHELNDVKTSLLENIQEMEQGRLTVTFLGDADEDDLFDDILEANLQACRNTVARLDAEMADLDRAIELVDTKYSEPKPGPKYRGHRVFIHSSGFGDPSTGPGL